MKLDGHCCKLEIRKYIILAHTAAHISSDDELIPEQGVSGTSTEHTTALSVSSRFCQANETSKTP